MFNEIPLRNVFTNYSTKWNSSLVLLMYFVYITFSIKYNSLHEKSTMVKFYIQKLQMQMFFLIQYLCSMYINIFKVLLHFGLTY